MSPRIRAAVMVGSVLAVLSAPSRALAQDYPPSPTPGTTVAGAGGAADAGSGVDTAFTGSPELTMLGVIIGVLVIAAIVALYAARSRRAS